MSTPIKDDSAHSRPVSGSGSGSGSEPSTGPGYKASSAIGLVAKRELRENLVKKGSVVTLVLGIILAVAGVIVAAYLTRDDAEAAEPTVIAVVGEAPFADALAQAPEDETPTPIELSLIHI